MTNVVAKTQWDWLMPEIIRIAEAGGRDGLARYLDSTAQRAGSNCARRAHQLITRQENSGLGLVALVTKITEMAAADGWEKI